jgi:hypothetical protein
LNTLDKTAPSIEPSSDRLLAIVLPGYCVSLPVPQFQLVLTINCEPKETSEEDDSVLDGWVTRVEGGSNPVIWYDELTNLAQRYLSEPENPEVKRAWVELLKSVGLEGMAQQPVVTVVGNSESH